MLDPSAAHTSDELLHAIDRGIEAHLAWNQRLMRVALLRESPGDEILRPNAHHLCELGRWLDAAQQELARYDPVTTEAILHVHQRMHDAVRSMCLALLQGQPSNADELSRFDANQRRLIELLHTLRSRVTEAAHRIDVLTGLPLRHGLHLAFEGMALQAARSGSGLWVMLADIDRFKSINDSFGHLLGDRALRHVAQQLAAGLRAQDLLIRFGGEEFLGLFVLPDTSAAERLAQRMLEAVRYQPLRIRHGLDLPLTVTLGWTLVRPAEALEPAVERTDQLMLLGKRQGRDRYVLGLDLPASVAAVSAATPAAPVALEQSAKPVAPWTAGAPAPA